MPIIDVSQKSYRTLVRAAHSRGMSIDRFIQVAFDGVGEDSGSRTTLPANNISSFSVEMFPSVSTPELPRTHSVPATAGSGFDALWALIENSAGEVISTKRGQGFTYKTDSGYLTIEENGVRIPRSQFKKALEQWAQNGPSNLRGVYAPSVVWAVLADQRILKNAA